MVLWIYLNSVRFSTSARRDVLRMHDIFGFGVERSVGVRHCGVVVLKRGVIGASTLGASRFL
jgi:hypothetical protein